MTFKKDSSDALCQVHLLPLITFINIQALESIKKAKHMHHQNQPQVSADSSFE